MENGITCVTIRTLEALRAALPEWHALWLADPNATPFQSPEWLLPWARQFGASELRTVMIYDHGSLCAVLPVYRQLESTGHRQLTLLGAGTSDYVDGTYSPTCTATHIRAGLNVVCAEDDWDRLSVFQLKERSPLRETLETSRFAGLKRIPAESCSRLPAVPLTRLPRSIREQARYYRKRAMRQGRVEFTLADKGNLLKMFEDLERLHTSRWRSSGKPGLLSDTRVVAWHREAMPMLLEKRLLRLHRLSLDGEAIAVLYSLIDPPQRKSRTEYFYLTAFSVQHAKLRPGMVLMAMAVEHAAQEGVQTLDLLRGDEAYKRLWHPEKLPMYGVSMPHPKRTSSSLSSTPSEEAAA
jgi:CelD/BcsL family acetyltransferase involved in cellulose biosynthesis